MGFPSEWLNGGLRLVDTPGVGSVHGHNSDVTHRYLPMADAVVFVSSADQPLSRNELDFLERVKGYAGKVFCLLNKMDYLSAEERRESLAFTRDVLRAAIGTDVPLFAICSRQALHARIEGDERLWADSGMATFDQALRAFLSNEGGHVWLESMRRQVLRLLSETRLTLALEQRSLTSPWEAMEQSLQAFAGRKAELQQARADLDALLDAAGRKLLRQRLEPDLASFKTTLRQATLAKLDNWCKAGQGLGALPCRPGWNSNSSSKFVVPSIPGVPQRMPSSRGNSSRSVTASGRSWATPWMTCCAIRPNCAPYPSRPSPPTLPGMPSRRSTTSSGKSRPPPAWSGRAWCACGRPHSATR